MVDLSGRSITISHKGISMVGNYQQEKHTELDILGKQSKIYKRMVQPFETVMLGEEK
jgi:hypothetical protein